MIKRNDLSIVLSGEAGQGIQTLERLLMKMFKLSGRFVFSYSEFMSRIRGGNNSTEMRVSSRRVAAHVDRIDLFVPFGPGAMDRFLNRITGNTVIIGDRENIDISCDTKGCTINEEPLTDLAKEIGGKVYLNLIIMGIFAGLFGIKEEAVQKQVRDYFKKLSDDLISRNVAAALKGMDRGRALAAKGNIPVPPVSSEKAADDILINGAESITLGGLAGGCNFVSSYPMSPSTDVFVNFARYSSDFGIAVEQAEDEISAINMALGSWYAGGRAMVTTSGGGFALMTEAMSLAGAIESPVVVHLGQRPGPATGLPTRTEQGDLLFALFSGHGDFPRAIFAPGNYQQGFYLTQRAFHIADKYQIPSIILTDQYYLDSNCSIPHVNIDDAMSRNIIVKTDADYKRFRFTDSGITPRGVPGYGDGIVCVDSDEHDEAGYITEDFDMRIDQMNKRMKKAKAMEGDILPPDLYGPKKYKNLIVAWGSTLHALLEALELSGAKDTAILHFTQVYPLHKNAAKLISKAARKIIVENNFSSQFSRLIRMDTGITFDKEILKYNGMPFSVEELAASIKKALRG